MKNYKLFVFSSIAYLAVILSVTFNLSILAAAQDTLDTSYNAGVSESSVNNYVSTIQPDGKILVGGGYRFVNGTQRSFLSRLNADGTVDASFNPSGAGPDGDVLEIIVFGDGKILIGGAFATYNGSVARRVARLNADGTLDTSFNSGTGVSGTGRVTEIVVQTDGKYVIAGQLLSGYNGITSNGIFRVNTDGSFDSSFVSGFATVPNNIEQISLQTDGKILIGGGVAFPLYGGTAINSSLLRVNPNGTLDLAFPTGGTSGIAGIAIQADGKILIGGAFTEYNGVARDSIARINPDGTLDNSFLPPSFFNPNYVEYFAVQSDGKILAAGSFSSLNGLNLPVIRLNADGSHDASLNSIGDNLGYHVTLQADGKILATGFFNRFTSGETRNGIARFNTNGTLDNTFSPSLTGYGSVNAMVQQADGKMIVAGRFRSANGNFSNGIARFNNDGTFDSTFATGTGAGTSVNFNTIPASLAVQPDGKILLGGNFGTFNGSTQKALIRLNSNGAVDSTFNLSGDLNLDLLPTVESIVVQPDNKIIIGGRIFNSLTQARGLFRLNANGNVDSSFNSGNATANATVNRVIRQTDGKLIIVGFFTTYSGTARARIARVNTDGTLDTAFNPGTGANNTVFDAALQADGKILIVGAFTTINGITQNRIARLNADGSLDTSFNSGAGADNTINSIAILPSGKLAIGGNFATYNGAAQNRLARLNADGTLDAAFNSGFDANPNFFVRRLLLKSDGKLLIGGQFTSYAGFARNSLAQLLAQTTPRTFFDYDGDGKADVSVFRPSVGAWYLNRSTAGFTGFGFGISTDRIVPADYDGDGKTDVGVFRNGNWYYLRSSDGAFSAVGFGQAGDIPVAADFDGDGKADQAVFRSGNWYLNRSAQGFTAVAFGNATDKPVAADYDGDGKADIAVYRDGNWYSLRSSDGGFVAVSFGNATDIPVPADYDGDGKTDQAVYRNGNWYLNRSTLGFNAVAFGIATDVPVAADYDGDGKADTAVYRDGNWYILQSTNGFTAQAFGTTGDKPTPSAFLP